MRQKHFHLDDARVAGIVSAVKENKAPDPLDRLRFPTNILMLRPAAGAHLIQQFRATGGRRCICFGHKPRLHEASVLNTNT
jgi:hypothetical protein